MPMVMNSCATCGLSTSHSPSSVLAERAEGDDRAYQILTCRLCARTTKVYCSPTVHASPSPAESAARRSA